MDDLCIHPAEQLRKLTVAVDQSPASVVITDKQGIIEYVNAKFIAVTGYSSEEALGQNPRVLKSGKQDPEVYEELWRTISSGREWHGEFHNKRKDGSLYWERASISPLRNDDGHITHYLALKEDITDWKQAQEELNFAYAQMHELFNSAPDATAVISNDYTILLINDTLASFLGVDKNEVLGRRCHEFLGNSMCDTADCPLRRIIGGEERVEADIHLRSANNSNTPCMFTAIPYRPVGKTLGIIKTFKDMTERKRAEEAMRNDFLLGAQIQRQFLPQPFINEKVGVDVIYQPYNHVSGDLCDFLWLTDTKLFGYVIDVMGHGLATALQTSALRVLFRQAASREGTVGEKMTWLNHAAVPYFAEDSFAGAICFEMDFHNMTMSYVSAGINFFVAATSRLQGVVTSPGLFLGIVEDVEFETHTVPLICGDAYYFVTDGIFDILDETVIANVRNYPATVQALRDKAASNKRWDDATALCLYINALPEKAFKMSFVDKQDFCNARTRVRHILEQMTGDKAGMLVVAVNEAANNAVRSAEAANRPFAVHMKLNRIGQWLVVRIKDSGDPFDGNGAVAAIEGAGCNLFEQAMLAESGRGIMILKALFQKVIYNRTGTEVLLARDLQVEDCWW